MKERRSEYKRNSVQKRMHLVDGEIYMLYHEKEWSKYWKEGRLRFEFDSS